MVKIIPTMSTYSGLNKPLIPARANDLKPNSRIGSDTARPCDFMPTLKIPALGIAKNLRDKLLATKPMENYDVEYVQFVVRTILSSTLGDISSVSASWNAKLNCWEGNVKHLGKDCHWVITRQKTTVPRPQKQPSN